MRTAPTVLDLVGVGFGPANLALALALEEDASSSRSAYSRLFLEAKRDFSWHKGMLLDGATMQISFLKDLVTQRNPQSPHSFLCYLKDRGRLADFLNLKDFFPTRLEFHDYFKWCSEAVGPVVRYNQKVLSVDLATPGGAAVATLAVTARGADGTERTHFTRAVSLAMGLAPRLPLGLAAGPRVWHTSDLLPRTTALAPSASPRFAVVGAGQSAAEAVEHLLARFPDARVHTIMSRLGFTPSDDTPFVNRVFDPTMVDSYHAMSPELRSHVRSTHANTNYSVVDQDLIAALYKRWYADRVAGRERLVLEPLSRLTDVEETADGLRLGLAAAAGPGTRALEVDYLVCATGYDPVSPDAVLSPALSALVERDASGAPIIERDYRLRTRAPLLAPIYVQGDCEASHGLSATLLSNLAPRAGEIRDSLAAYLAGLQEEARYASA
ncbi:SidA/IucD/PvdA family monooxygenase [Salinarimonas sp.]|uniref:lysine N(6)-hydroxylase/L-ornithine N(5)-oxygenase family protein n=1 Tax=Salinarimonas sp. TaxID=2766526 RepID=UPI0032D8DFC0